MKWIKRIAWTVFAGVLILLAGSVLYMFYLCPDYEGEMTMPGLQDQVEVIYDQHGIPHIYAQSETDAFQVMGYIHASERLFQMEMIRRAVQGRLAEILGPDLVDTDRFFRTLSISETAKQSASSWPEDPAKKSDWHLAAEAYLLGVNTYLEQGKTPVEFSLIGIPTEPFTIQNFYEVSGYMSFGFAEGIKMDPLIEKIRTELGPDYLTDLVLHHHEGDQTIPVFSKDSPKASQPSLSAHVHRIVEQLPVSPFIGSNSWVLAPSRSASGQVIHANDPHIGYGQPAVWYEAHLEAPGLSNYGYFLAGSPFPILGHNRYAAIGMTMFENDDVNFYRETLSADQSEVKFQDSWEPLTIREEKIFVKDAEPVDIEVRTTRHGPLISDVFRDFRMSSKGPQQREDNDTLSIWSAQPVALFWTFLQSPSRTLEATYRMVHMNSMEDARQAASMISAPGLNIMYGDIAGNIAWWTTGKLARYGDHVNTKLFLDGASGEDEIIRWLDFDENPHAVNPPSGYVYSANNQPAADSSGFYYPGYYFPESRARRIVELLESREIWTAEQVQGMILDDVNISHLAVAREFVNILKQSDLPETEPTKTALAVLQNWEGEHSLESGGPVVFYKLLYHVLEQTFGDELGTQDFEVFVTSPLRKRSLPYFVSNDSSVWWDDIRTDGATETRDQIITAAFEQSLIELTEQLGSDVDAWKWGTVHTLTHRHLVGQQEPLSSWFNVGPFPAPGGEEVINNIGFRLNGSGQYPATHGPSRRAIIDFADLENSRSILPSGQSGRVMSPYYDDQAELYVAGKFRPQLMNRASIEAQAAQRIQLLPASP